RRTCSGRGRVADREALERTVNLCSPLHVKRGVAMRMRAVVCASALLLSGAAGASAQTALSGPQLRVTPATGVITVDGELGDPGWEGASRIDTFYETSPGDNLEPKVRSIGYLAYDSRFFYAAFELDDPDPTAIRAPFADHDNISGDFTDYAGVILDTRNDGHSAVLLLASPRGVQYDAATEDAADEDSSPDF